MTASNHHLRVSSELRASAAHGTFECHCAGWTGLDWTGLDWTGLDWTGLDWTGLDWTGLDRTGLDWTGLHWLTATGAPPQRW